MIETAAPSTSVVLYTLQHVPRYATWSSTPPHIDKKLKRERKFVKNKKKLCFMSVK